MVLGSYCDEDQDEAVVGGFLHALSSTGSIVIGVKGLAAPLSELGSTTVLTNDLGAEVYPDPGATRWLTFFGGDDQSEDPSAQVEPALVFPASDAIGKAMLDPAARRLTLAMTSEAIGQVRFEWELPLQQSRLALDAWNALPDAGRGRLTSMAAQCTIDLRNRALLWRQPAWALGSWLPEGALDDLRQRGERVVLCECTIEGCDAEQVAARLRLLGSHGEQMRAEVVTDLAETLLGAPVTEDSLGAPGDLFAFRLVGPGGRPVLDETDGLIRIALLAYGDETVVATYEFPPLARDASAQH